MRFYLLRAASLALLPHKFGPDFQPLIAALSTTHGSGLVASQKKVAMGKTDMLFALRQVLRESFTLQHEGGSYAKLSRAQGVADGYMRALLDGGFATNRELLALVADERAAVRGPATREIELQVA